MLSAHQILASVFGYDQTTMWIYGSRGLEEMKIMCDLNYTDGPL
jgi:hypothetical protein